MSDRADLGEAGTTGGGADHGQLVDVHLLQVPIAVQEAADRHIQALEREFELLRRRDDDAEILPHRLRRLVDELSGRFAHVGEEPRQRLAAAIERGEPSVDLHYRVPPEVAAAAHHLGALLDEADAYCEAGDQLLTLVTPPDLRRYRQWFLGEFERQVAGAPPTPWPAFDEVDGEIDDEPAAAPRATAPTVRPAREAVRGGGPLPDGWEVTVEADGSSRVHVVGPLDLVSAPALRDILIDVVAGSPRVAVDLSRCDFLDSVGLSVLLAAMARAQEQGAAVAFRLSEAADRVLTLSGVLERFDVEA